MELLRVKSGDRAGVDVVPNERTVDVVTSRRWPSLRLLSTTILALSVAAVALIVTSRSRSSAISANAREILDVTVTDSMTASMRIVSIPLTATLQNANSPLELTRAASSAVTLPPGTSEAEGRPGADQSWVLVRSQRGSPGSELALLERTGRVTPIAQGDGDNIHPSWSPDGGRLAFATSRWRGGGHTDIATYDLQSRVVTQVSVPTTSDENDQYPVWSTDGSRIAFIRLDQKYERSSLCVADLTIGTTTCVRVSGLSADPFPSWRSDSTLIVTTRRGDTAEISEVVVASGRTNRIQATRGTVLALTGDGDWILGADELRRSTDRWTITIRRVSATAQSNAASQILLDAGVRVRNLKTRRVDRTQRASDSARIADSRGNSLLQVPHELHAEIWRPSGGWIDVPVKLWSVSDSTIASIDSRGVLTALSVGSVKATALLADGRHLTRVIVADSLAPRIVFEELWSLGISAKWRAFGEPSPRVVQSSIGAALDNNGDGSYVSGAYAVQLFDVTNGTSVDVEASTPISQQQWQLQHIMLIFGQSITALAKWDHVTGYFWGDARSWGAQCGLKIPSGPEGPTYSDHFAATVGMNARTMSLPEGLRRGTPFHLRIQTFPDGRCGVAINGVPVAVGQLPANATLGRLALWGNSVGTTMAVGKITVRTGVQRDIDWTHISP
jgi:hypothetical protein